MRNGDYTTEIYQSITINITSNQRMLSLTVKWYQAVRNFSARFRRFIDQSLNAWNITVEIYQSES